jgi:hypothetical protein
MKCRTNNFLNTGDGQRLAPYVGSVCSEQSIRCDFKARVKRIQDGQDEMCLTLGAAFHRENSLQL